ncbi:MAG: gliding motility-associated C-terminal domain-containing protein [Bacteroidia bacterium]|nr:gliding motility-associated C-terminal domain-containing protein [Bacteroidia bacterium]
MRGIKPFLFCCLFALFSSTSVYGQESYCKNLGFELGDFTNWVGYNWIYSTDVPSNNTAKVQVALPTARRQVIMTDTTAYDVYTGNALKKIPHGYLYSARLGDAITSADVSSFRCWEQSLRYTMTIDSTNALLIMKFALVLQYVSDHTAKMEPRFKLTLFDQKGDTIPDCANYDVYSTSNNVKGFQSYTPSGSNTPVKWRDWTTVGANLLKYMGQTITIEFMAADCTGRFHYGYAYFVAACHPLYITVQYCAGDSVAKLKAPEGFEKYSWTNSSGVVVDSVQTLKVVNPVEGSTFSCTMTSATGCTVSLKSTIAKYIIKTDFSNYMIDCKSNKVQFTSLSTTTRGSLSYKWDFGDGKTSAEVNPRYTFATSGMHEIRLSLINPPSTCVDTLTRKIESFSPPLVGINGASTYCPNQSIFLKAYGAYSYTWSNSSKADSIKVSAPGGKFWLLGRSSTGCVSDTIYKTVSEEPYWKLLTECDTILCPGERAILKVSGAVSYLWNTNTTTDTISVSTPGTYSVTGTNMRGCQKSATVSVVEYTFPKLNFTTSGSLLNSRHNQLTCSLPAEAGVQYFWDMGDGLTETGSTIQHTYNISNAILEYTISLTATSKYGCAISASKIVDVVPFIPNVFSPNGDGINDVFMPEITLQVFDRYGTVLYKGTAGWDGTYKGQPADTDTYFYLINYTDKNQQVQTQKGYITLVR